MSNRWFIYKEGRALGPFTPEEIRASLRDGAFDPFDLVAREGSSLRRELVEVDELFFTTKVVDGEEPVAGAAPPPAAGGSPAPGDGFDELAALAGPGGHVPDLASLPANLSSDDTRSSARSADMVAGNGHMALALDGRDTQHSAPAAPADDPGNGGGGAGGTSGGTGTGARKPRPRRDPKHFHLLDRSGKMLGPLSGSEIRALYYKGVLDKSVKVMRDRSSAKVPIAKFIAIYSERSGRQGPQQGAHPSVDAGKPNPMQRMMQAAPNLRRRLKPLRGMSRVAIAAIVAAVVFIMAAAYVVWFESGGRWLAGLGDVAGSDDGHGAGQALHPAHRRKTAKPDQTLDGRDGRDGRGKGRRRRGQRDPLSAPSGGFGASEAGAPDATANSGSPETAKRRKDRDGVHGQRPRGAGGPNGGSDGAAAGGVLGGGASAFGSGAGKGLHGGAQSKLPHPSSSTTQPASLQPGKGSPWSSPHPAAAPSAPAPALTAKPQGSGGGAGALAALNDGQRVNHLGPMTFDKGALAACQGSCTITFSGAGGSVRVAFFKEAWASTLEAKSGGVYISGAVRKGAAGAKILLSNAE